MTGAEGLPAWLAHVRWAPDGRSCWQGHEVQVPRGELDIRMNMGYDVGSTYLQMLMMCTDCTRRLVVPGCSPHLTRLSACGYFSVFQLNPLGVRREQQACSVQPPRGTGAGDEGALSRGRRGRVRKMACFSALKASRQKVFVMHADMGALHTISPLSVVFNVGEVPLYSVSHSTTLILRLACSFIDVSLQKVLLSQLVNLVELTESEAIAARLPSTRNPVDLSRGLMVLYG